MKENWYMKYNYKTRFVVRWLMSWILIPLSAICKLLEALVEMIGELINAYIGQFSNLGVWLGYEKAKDIELKLRQEIERGAI